MFFSFLAILQLHSTWAYTHQGAERRANQAIQKLQAALPPSQTLSVRDVMIKKGGETDMRYEWGIPQKHQWELDTRSYYCAFILFEVLDNH